MLGSPKGDSGRIRMGFIGAVGAAGPRNTGGGADGSRRNFSQDAALID